MASNTDLHQRLNAVNALLDAYMEWFAALAQCSARGEGCADVEAPKAFLDWAGDLSFENIDIDGKLEPQKEQLLSEHQALVDVSKGLSAENFSEFSEALRNTVSALGRFGQDVALEQAGVDLLTGLYNRLQMEKDLAVEQDRLSREGAPFCLAVARVDGFREIRETLDGPDVENVIKTASALIQKSLRAYDSAYRIGPARFVMCLKQADMVSGQMALKRLREVLDANKAVYTLGDEEKLLSLSCCVAEPLAEDDVCVLLENLTADLDKQAENRGDVLTYRELSPVQRYIRQEKA